MLGRGTEQQALTPTVGRSVTATINSKNNLMNLSKVEDVYITQSSTFLPNHTPQRISGRRVPQAKTALLRNKQMEKNV